MSFIDSTYFVGEINIPNASTDASLAQAITQYEKEILIQLLGYKLYSLLIADLTGTPPAPITQKYIDLFNGAEFTHSYRGQDITLKWEGLKNTALQSLIAYYVFYKYVERDVTRLYGAGVSMAPSGNEWQRVSPVNKLIAAWDRMRELYGKIPPEYKRYNISYSFPEVSNILSLSQVFDCDPSAYNFLFANRDDYPDWIFTPQWNINALGI
jgi:hypothetical protein